MKKLVGTVTAALIVALVAMLLPQAALAHARYKSSTPAKGEVLQVSPIQAQITFTEEIQKVTGTYGITVEKDRGASVTAGPTVIDEQDRSKMSVPLQADLPAGRYVVRWKNVSDADGDPLEGAFSFYVKTQPNAVDLANDKQLEAIGAAEETPDATTEATSAATSPANTTPAATRAAATPGSSAGSGGGRNTWLYAGVGVVVAVVIGAAGAWFMLTRGRS